MNINIKNKFTIHMKNVTKGNELMLFLDNKSLAQATSHSLSITGNTIDIASKDMGVFGASEIGTITWEITSENLYTDDYHTLFSTMIARQPVTAVFGQPNNYNVNGLGDTSTYWIPDASVGAKYYQGPAIVTSLELNAPNGENATYSITLTGNGALEQKTVQQA